MGLTLRPVGSESKAGGTARSTLSGVGLAAPATTSASRVPVVSTVVALYLAFELALLPRRWQAAFLSQSALGIFVHRWSSRVVREFVRSCIAYLESDFRGVGGDHYGCRTSSSSPTRCGRSNARRHRS